MFRDILDLEGNLVGEGISRGKKDGLAQGYITGYELGQKKGFDIGQEVGFYIGCVTGWLQLSRELPSLFSPRSNLSQT